MAKINALINGKTYKVCEKHQAYGREDLDDMFNCPDCRCMGTDPTTEELIADTAQDNEPADADSEEEAAALHRRIKALDIS